MKKTYKSSNVRFCMEDENQRRTWEYLQSLTRKDSSYGKALSDRNVFFDRLCHFTSGISLAERLPLMRSVKGNKALLLTKVTKP